MSKHNRSQAEKTARNLIYARKFRQLRCENCGHRTSRSGRCGVCGWAIRSEDYAKSIRRESR